MKFGGGGGDIFLKVISPFLIDIYRHPLLKMAWGEKNLKPSAQSAISELSQASLKTRLCAQPLMWKWSFILVQIKIIFTKKVVHLALF